MADTEVRQTNTGDGGTNWILVILALVLVVLIAWFLFAGGRSQPTNVEVETPQADAPEVEVPEQIDVNINADQPDGT